MTPPHFRPIAGILTVLEWQRHSRRTDRQTYSGTDVRRDGGTDACVDDNTCRHRWRLRVKINLRTQLGLSLWAPFLNCSQANTKNTSDDKSTLAQVMASCHYATSYYLSPCSPRSKSLNGVTRSRWVEPFLKPSISHSFHSTIAALHHWEVNQCHQPVWGWHKRIYQTAGIALLII